MTITGGPMGIVEMKILLEQLRGDPKYIGINREKELLTFLLAGLVTNDISFGHLKWFLGLSKEEKDRLMKASWFVPVTQFKVTVPQDYCHDTFLGDGRRKIGDMNIAREIADGIFNKPSDRLVAGKTYTVKIVRARKNFFVLDGHWGEKDAYQGVCLDFLKEQRAVLCGAHGLLLAYQQGGDQFPRGELEHTVVSLDELSVLPVLPRGDDNVDHVPCISISSKDNWRDLHAKCFHDSCSGDPYLLFFCDEE